VGLDRWGERGGGSGETRDKDERRKTEITMQDSDEITMDRKWRRDYDARDIDKGMEEICKPLRPASLTLLLLLSLRSLLLVPKSVLSWSCRRTDAALAESPPSSRARRAARR